MSNLFKLNFRDIAVGLLLAVGGAVLITVQNTISSNVALDWNVILKVAESTFLAYLLKNFFSDSQGKIAGKF